MSNITGLDFKIGEMAGRIRDLREIEGLSIAEMAKKTGVTEKEYADCEAGLSDLPFAFIYRCALAFNVDVTDIIEGKSPKLESYTLTRKGTGAEIREAHSMVYHNLAASFKNRIAEPLYVRLHYTEEALHKDIEMTTHDGQECDIVVTGTLKVQIGEHKEILHEGDCIYYDSSTPHGMIALDGADCYFYAIVLNPSGAAIPEFAIAPKASVVSTNSAPDEKQQERIYNRFVDTVEDENGTPVSIRFKNTEKFNFAFDIVDALGREKPDKTAMMWLSGDKTHEHRFTFSEMMKESARCANYFKSIGIKRGDRVMLILKRHYQFWFAMLGLNKIGALAIPGTNQLLAHDLDYRFRFAGVTAVLCTADGASADNVDEAEKTYGQPLTKIIVNGTREGWRTFDEEYKMYSSHYNRPDDAPCGDDPMLAYFTSGTTGFPKLAVHNYKYPLGHFHTAKYWHCVEPDGLHLTISDTGWAKAMWGKLYGQWLCEGATFVYDFDRFDAAQILPLFAQYKITTFCAPPTMLRMLIKEDLSKYDFSSLHHMTTAGEALNPEVYKQFEAATGLKIMEGFGQSETTCILGNFIGAPHKLGSMGRPAPIYDVHLLDSEGNEVRDGETGEICIRVADGAPCGLFTGYYNAKDKTDEVWHDGYYHTCDLAWRDEDGFYWYVSRVDDVIKSSGYRIGPFEIESVIMELPYVLECGVSAVPDEVRGQIVKASIVLTKGTEGTDALKKEIQNYVKVHTAPYKYPRVVEFRTELPKTTSGKIIRSKL